MLICHCCHRIAHGRQAGKLNQECWREGGGTAQSHRPGVQQALFFFQPFYESRLWYLMNQPVIQSPEGESCSFTPCPGLSQSIAVSWQPVLILFQVLFSPSIQWYCRQLFFFPVFPKALLVLVLPWIKHLIWNNLKIPLLEILLEYMPWGKRADFPQLQNSGQVGKENTFLEVVLGLWRAFSTWNQQSKKENKL